MLEYLYLSGTTFFTLGLGDVAPVSAVGRVLVVVEARIGFAFLALVIGAHQRLEPDARPPVRRPADAALKEAQLVILPISH